MDNSMIMTNIITAGIIELFYDLILYCKDFIICASSISVKNIAFLLSIISFIIFLIKSYREISIYNTNNLYEMEKNQEILKNIKLGKIKTIIKFIVIIIVISFYDDILNIAIKFLNEFISKEFTRSLLKYTIFECIISFFAIIVMVKLMLDITISYVSLITSTLQIIINNDLLNFYKCFVMIFSPIIQIFTIWLFNILFIDVNFPLIKLSIFVSSSLVRNLLFDFCKTEKPIILKKENNLIKQEKS
ncbi:MAG: hypothetical protein K0R54_264 [Clostridiaceae bacterium]|jgi:hypothetical protein|nr:hypothetical protein [Clostridiaceae bacterium]